MAANAVNPPSSDSHFNLSLNSSNVETDIISSLKSQLQSLQDRVKELESENEKLSAQFSNCHCQKVCFIYKSSSFIYGCALYMIWTLFFFWLLLRKSKGSVNISHIVKEIEGLKLVGDGVEKNSKETSSGSETRPQPRFHKRYVALKIMYFGQRFYGFASEAQMDPTIESEIFKALKKTRLIVGADKKEMQYSRCGRTDKGVSSVG